MATTAIKSRFGEWSEFEKQLIDYVKERPIIYDSNAKLYKTGETRAQIKSLWKVFARKWHFSAIHCKSRWYFIKKTYFIIKREQNKKAAADKKYMDGRLSFLDAMITRDQKIAEGERTAAEAPSKHEATNKKPIEYYYNMGVIEKREKFTEFEELLINFVKKYPVLYDPRISLNIETASREKIVNDLWEKLRVDASGDDGESVPDCQTTWNKISMEYYRVRSVEEKHQINEPSFFKYFDENLNFLKPMYLLVKDTAIDVFHAESIEKAIQEIYLTFKWNDFELAVIDYVEKNPIIYDGSQHRTAKSLKSLREQLWMAFAAELKQPDFRTGMKCWSQIKTSYRQYLNKLTDKSVINSVPFRYLRYQKLTFLSEVLKEDNDSTPAQYSCTASEEIDNLSIQDESEDDDDCIEEMSINVKPEEETNLYDSVLEIEDNFVSNRNLISHNDEPRPSTSATINRPVEKSSEGINMMISVESERSLAENNIKSKECGQKPISMLNHHNLSTLEFFREIGKIVTDNFGKKKQKHIRLKCWSLVTELELAMLRDDETSVPT